MRINNQEDEGLEAVLANNRIHATAAATADVGNAVILEIASNLKRLADHFAAPHDPQPKQINGAGDDAPTPLPQRRKSPYMDSDEAAAYLGITVKSLYGQVERQRIRPLRGPRRTYRFTTEMLDEYLRS
jgi:excisionase family DNA binding protein